MSSLEAGHVQSIWGSLAAEGKLQWLPKRRSVHIARVVTRVRCHYALFGCNIGLIDQVQGGGRLLREEERRWILYCLLEIVPEEFGLVMQFPRGLQPFRPSPSTESFLTPLLLDVIMKEKFRDTGYRPADVPRISVPGANGEERYGGYLPLASFALSTSNFHNFKHGTGTGCLFNVYSIDIWFWD